MIKKGFKYRLAALLLAAVVFLPLPSAMAEPLSVNPLIDPPVITEYTETEDDFFNILLLGVDYGFSGYWGSGKKTKLENCHTDAVMVLSVNLDRQKINLVSIPRDTFTYIPTVRLEEKANPFTLPQNQPAPSPAVHGIYKLNAAINCADTTEQGIKNTCAAVSWLLGGIEIDRYIAVDMNAMIALGDAMGGVDFDVDMSYSGHSGTYYHAGMQHLDGQGIMDYVRARRNATVDANDVGRTGRQRRMIAAILQKLLGNIMLINNVYNVMENGSINIFKNVDQNNFFELAGAINQWSGSSLSADDLFASYVLTGSYQWGMTKWLFTFTDQQNRLDVLKTVYGIDADPLPFVSKEYADWLLKSDQSYTLEDGMMNARYIRVAQQILDYAHSLPFLAADQQSAVDALTTAWDAAAAAFTQASSTLSKADTQVMQAAVQALVPVAEAAAATVEYPRKIQWDTALGWWMDPVLYDYIINWE